MRNKPSKKDVLDEDGLWPGPCSCAGRTPRQGERTSRLAHGMSLLEDFSWPEASQKGDLGMDTAFYSWEWCSGSVSGGVIPQK